MADTYEIHEVEDEKTWDGLVRASSGGSVFSTSEWLACAQAASGGEIRLLGCYRNGRLVGGCGFLEIRKGGLRKAITPVLTSYGGILYLPPGSERPSRIEAERNRIASEMIEDLSRRFHYVQLSHPPSFEDIRPFRWANWETRTNYTYIVDVSDIDRLWEQFEPSLQRQIKKAQRNGLAVREADDIEAFVPHYLATYERQGVPPSLPVEGLVKFYQALRERNLCQMFLAEAPDGCVLSGCIVAFGFGTSYNWIAGADPRFRESGATPLLFWSVFQRLSGEFAHFDLVGANIPSIARFKRSFGGTLRPYYVTEKYRSALSAAAMKGYTHLRRLTRR